MEMHYFRRRISIARLEEVRLSIRQTMASNACSLRKYTVPKDRCFCPEEAVTKLVVRYFDNTGYIIRYNLSVTKVKYISFNISIQNFILVNILYINIYET